MTTISSRSIATTNTYIYQINCQGCQDRDENGEYANKSTKTTTLIKSQTRNTVTKTKKMKRKRKWDFYSGKSTKKSRSDNCKGKDHWDTQNSKSSTPSYVQQPKTIDDNIDTKWSMKRFTSLPVDTEGSSTVRLRTASNVVCKYSCNALLTSWKEYLEKNREGTSDHRNDAVAQLKMARDHDVSPLHHQPGCDCGHTWPLLWYKPHDRWIIDDAPPG